MHHADEGLPATHTQVSNRYPNSEACVITLLVIAVLMVR
ncbi:hypothetical protein TM48_00173 [Mycobacterium shottsii]|nr:hypothetical protein TM48_00173 [Mycobacterium shottsii]